jgi:predicted Zn-dependent protease
VKVPSILLSASLVLAVAAPASAQFGLLEQGAKRAKQVSDFTWTDQEKAALGAKVSELVRQRYGVVQDPAVHKYVTLVGRTVTEKTTKPGLPWTFIVLDTDAVNAFAAPHGYVHITRGALALMKNEAELAGVLAHEIVHVTEEHTIDALKKNTLKSAAAEEVSSPTRRTTTSSTTRTAAATRAPPTRSASP